MLAVGAATGAGALAAGALAAGAATGAGAAETVSMLAITLP
ncbi:hypothetical protein swp_4750 [Shewanella piezotolerans WP3]|uniref:Uncharacterized protein n=1 Tax=Shewanella piezotolerans (strain WP3 / JCM 13877) TaxID=225849 RepID=B8CTY8_SHEPW|nr:hypothetical protein swp_4750 [Shewanella piezotolerans WP3]